MLILIILYIVAIICEGKVFIFELRISTGAIVFQLSTRTLSLKKVFLIKPEWAFRKRLVIGKRDVYLSLAYLNT